MSRTNGFGAAAVKAVNPTVSDWYLLLPNAGAHKYILRRCVLCCRIGFLQPGSYWSEAAAARTRTVARACDFKPRRRSGRKSMLQ